MTDNDRLDWMGEQLQVGHKVKGFREVPGGWNSAIWIERSSAAGDPELTQEYRCQVIHEPGSNLLTYDWVCESRGIIHLKSGEVELSGSPENMTHARELLQYYMNQDQEPFGIDMSISLASWQ